MERGGGHDSRRVSYVDVEVTGKGVVRAGGTRLRKDRSERWLLVIEVTEEV